MDRLLRLNELIIIDSHLLFWHDYAIPTELNNCICSDIYLKKKKTEDLVVNTIFYCFAIENL